MKERFPAEISAQEINLIKLLFTGPLEMLQVDQFGRPGESSVGGAVQQGVAPLEDRPDVNGGEPAI